MYNIIIQVIRETQSSLVLNKRIANNIKELQSIYQFVVYIEWGNLKLSHKGMQTKMSLRTFLKCGCK